MNLFEVCRAQGHARRVYSAGFPGAAQETSSVHPGEFPLQFFGNHLTDTCPASPEPVRGVVDLHTALSGSVRVNH
jgi:hypothetical protein